MAKATEALPYLRRALEDEFVQEQLRDAVSWGRAAYLRARKQPAQTPDDKVFYRNVRQAATAFQKATNALRAQPPPPKHRGRKLATVALAIGATAFITIKLQAQDAQRSDAPDPMTSPPPTAGGTGAAATTRSDFEPSAGVPTA